MKKNQWIGLLMAMWMLMALVMTGCGSTRQEAPQSGSAPAPVEQEESKEVVTLKASTVATADCGSLTGVPCVSLA